MPTLLSPDSYWLPATYIYLLSPGRLDGFFKVLPKTGDQIAAQKRKNEEKIQDRKKKQKQEAAAKKASKGRPRGGA